MVAPFYFISYSRNQLYFAESVAVQLQRMKVDVWFDLQQLKTGENWASEIKRGLDECAGVILIVSQQSIASKYVESEWRAALDSGKPIYLIYFEPAELTDERLKSCPSVDGRGRFKAAVRQLSRAIKEGETPHEGARFWKVHPPKRLAHFLAADDDGIMRFPTKLAPGVLMITLSVLGISLTLLLTMLMVAMIMGIPFSLWLGALAGYGILASSHYVRRKLVGSPPRFFVIIALLGTMGLLLFTQSFPAQQRTLVVFVVMIAAFTGMFVLAFVLRGGDVLRWTLTGFADERVRRWYHGGRWVRRTGKGDHTITYRILHSRGDEKFAKRLVGAMNKYKHMLAANQDDQPNQYTFFLLSNVTVWDEVRAALQAYPRLIAAAMTTVKLPQDVKDQMGRFQYLDARTDAKRRFNAMAASLTETQVQSSTLSASIETTPSSLDLTVIPRRVQAGLGALRLYAVVGFVAPVLVVLQLILMGSTSNIQFTPLEIIVSVIAALVFAVFCFMLDYLARFRQITTRRFMLVYAAGMILYAVVTSVFGGVQILSPDIGANPLSVIPSILAVFITSSGVFAWLPAIAPHKLSLSDVRAQAGSVIRDVILISIIGTYAAFVILVTTFLGGIGAIQTFSANTITIPAYFTGFAFGSFSVDFPHEMRGLSVTSGQVDAFGSSPDMSVRTALQTLVDQVSQQWGTEFAPYYAAYSVGTEGGVLYMVAGKLWPSSENNSPDYGKQRLQAFVQKSGEGVVYQPKRSFGREPNIVQGAFGEFTLPNETGAPKLGNIVVIDTVTDHFLIYIASSDTPAMRTLRDQFYSGFANSQ